MIAVDDVAFGLASASDHFFENVKGRCGLVYSPAHIIEPLNRNCTGNVPLEVSKWFMHYKYL